MTIIIGHILAIAIGLSLGLIGGGGSILAVPILVYVMGLNSKIAIAMSLVIVGTVSIIGAIPHWRQGNINFKTAILFTPAAMMGAYLGAKVTALPFITDTFQLICFGIIMVIASVFMIRKASQKTDTQNVGLKTSGKSSAPKFPPWLAILFQALVVGVITGFVGVGGGFLIIPALVLWAGIPMKEAIGTSLVIIAANSTTGFLGYVTQVTIDWNLVISFIIAASAGIILGAYLTKYIDAKKLQKSFGYFVLAVAIFVLIKR
jgi:uncharacterized membrane protein YfcA